MDRLCPKSIETLTISDRSKTSSVIGICINSKWTMSFLLNTLELVIGIIQNDF